MNVDSLDAVVTAIAFLLPGFILSTMLGMRFRLRSRTGTELVLQYITLSCFNHGIWSWLIVLMVYSPWFQSRAWLTASLVFLILFISPVTIGLLIGQLSRVRLVQRLLSAFGFKIHRFIPTAWDFKFEREEASWVIVQLKDRSMVFGFLGSESFSGDDPDERDLYIEAVFRPVDGHDHWQPVPDTSGILIKADQIATIEFRRLTP